jgi:hypothetical protein
MAALAVAVGSSEHWGLDLVGGDFLVGLLSFSALAFPIAVAVSCAL